jgi:type I restriction enzyme S subunit
VKYPKYPAYKDSGSDWLGEIPQHWGKAALKHLVNPQITDGPHETPEFFDDGYPFLSAEAVKNNTLDFNKKRGFIDLATFERYLQKCRPQHNDILLVKSGNTTGSVAFVETDEVFAIWSPLALIRTKPELDSRFAFHCMNSLFFQRSIALFSSYGTQPNIGMGVIENLVLTVPPREEQTTIAAFLDAETAQIDTLIAKQERLIALLQEKRQALISHAVTRGLDPAAPMKDSGVEWLGEVPAHWEVTRLRFASTINPTKSEIAGLPASTEVSFVPMEAIGEYGGLRLETTKPIEEVLQGYTYFRDGDVVLAKITPCFENGKGALAGNLVAGVAFGTTELHVLRPHIENTDPQFLFYVSISTPFRKLGEGEMYGAGGQKRIPNAFVENFKQPFPPLEEQTTIAAFLDAETALIDTLIEKNRAAIDRLHERRTALISAAVTGKIDVRAAMN